MVFTEHQRTYLRELVERHSEPMSQAALRLFLKIKSSRVSVGDWESEPLRVRQELLSRGLVTRYAGHMKSTHLHL